MIIYICTVKRNNCKSIIITSIIVMHLLLFNSCNLSPNRKIEKIQIDTIPIVVKKKIPNPTIIDSIKMHAFDNVFFGTKEEIISSSFTINNIEFNVGTTQLLENGQLCYLEIESNEKITTQKRAKKIVNELKNTISIKYSNSLTLNKTYYVKHPEEMDKDENHLSFKNMYKYDKNTIGLPYEFVAYKWNLKYKEIQIGYLIDLKNRTRYMQSKPQDDYYTVYVQFKSKILKRNDEKTTNNDTEKDSKKF
jgi:hypothetical protein